MVWWWEREERRGAGGGGGRVSEFRGGAQLFHPNEGE